MFKNFQILCGILLGLVFISLFINLNTGFLDLKFSDFWNDSVFFSEIINLRINRVLVILLAGISIPTSGFLLQEYFRNPLAGPSVLGITSVASLSVAFYVLLSKNIILTEFLDNSFISIFAIGGSLILLVFLLLLI